eukprot:GHVR01035725.1.p2 GENE.GHVR01035725.1~~GHVR01035725.1.p2  ORF type:complete len:387 (-),score=108.28 GHVR01035725.1:25-1185(-)
MSLLSVVERQTEYTHTDKLDAIRSEGFSFSAYKKFVKEFMGEVFVDALVMGNISMGATVSLFTTAVFTLGARPLSSSDAVQYSSLSAITPLEVRLSSPKPSDTEHAIVIAYQLGVADVSGKAALEMAGELVKGPLFDVVRTKEQLGYIVSAAVVHSFPVSELRVIVQGGVEGPDVMEKRVEEVLEELRKTWGQTIPDPLIAQLKVELAMKHAPMDPSLLSHFDRWWGQIRTHSFCFSYEIQLLEFLVNSRNTGALVADLFGVLTQSSPFRKKIAIKLFGGGKDPLENSSDPQWPHEDIATAYKRMQADTDTHTHTYGNNTHISNSLQRPFVDAPQHDNQHQQHLRGDTHTHMHSLHPIYTHTHTHTHMHSLHPIYLTMRLIITRIH